MGVTPHLFKGQVKVGIGLWGIAKKAGEQDLGLDGEVSNEFHAYLCVLRRVVYQKIEAIGK